MQMYYLLKTVITTFPTRVCNENSKDPGDTHKFFLLIPQGKISRIIRFPISQKIKYLIPDTILAFLDHLPPCIDMFYVIIFDKKWTFLDTYPPHLVNIVCEQPLSQILEEQKSDSSFFGEWIFMRNCKPYFQQI